MTAEGEARRHAPSRGCRGGETCPTRQESFRPEDRVMARARPRKEGEGGVAAREEEEGSAWGTAVVESGQSVGVVFVATKKWGTGRQTSFLSVKVNRLPIVFHS